jgi:hypothetical protein
VADASWPRGSNPDDGWGPATSRRSTAAQVPDSRQDRPKRGVGRASAQPSTDGGTNWTPSFGSAPAQADSSGWNDLHAAGSGTLDRGLAGWAALLVLIAATMLGILVDAVRGQQLGSGFDIGIIAGSVSGILLVRRSGMFVIVVAPPIVYSLSAGISLYVRSSGLHDRGVLIDAATNWLVYGFPAIAAASAAVLIIAGIRMITRR